MAMMPTTWRKFEESWDHETIRSFSVCSQTVVLTALLVGMAMASGWAATTTARGGTYPWWRLAPDSWRLSVQLVVRAEIAALTYTKTSVYTIPSLRNYAKDYEFSNITTPTYQACSVLARRLITIFQSIIYLVRIIKGKGKGKCIYIARFL